MFQRRNRQSATRGFSLVELLVVVAVVGTVLALALPAMKEVLDVRRLRAIHAQVATDMSWARSEAMTRRAHVRMKFLRTPGVMPYDSCYVIWISDTIDMPRQCSCLSPPSCQGDSVMLRMQYFSASQGVMLWNRTVSNGFGFEPLMGSLVTAQFDTPTNDQDTFVMDTQLTNSARRLRIMLNQTGRVTICSPSGTTLGERPC
jgi:type IV fimbrial biogenesis protein FimT